MKAYMWDEAKVSLQAYCAKVKRYVDTFDNDIVETPTARAAQYYLRFVNGLPDDYLAQVKMSSKTTIEKAMDICIRFQGLKKSNKVQTETAASVKFEDETPHRVTKNETDIKRLMNQMKTMEETGATSKSPSRSNDRQESSYQNQTAGGKHYSKYPNSSSGDKRNSTAGSSPYPKKEDGKQNPRFDGRMKRLIASQQRRYRGRNWKEQPKNTEEGGFALQSDVDSASEDLNDTIVQFNKWEEERLQEERLAALEEFCEVWDEEKKEN